MTDLILALHTARTARAEAAQRHTAATQALERAQQARTAAKAECDRLADLDEAAIARAARRLETQAREGDSGSLPQVTPGDEHLLKQIIATRTLRAAELAVANLEREFEQAAGELRRTETLLHGARGAVVAARVRELLAELDGVRKREVEIVRAISVIQTGDPGAGQLPAEALKAVAYPPARPTADSIVGNAVDLNTPIGGTRKLNEEARCVWRTYLEQLERDPPAGSTPAAAA